MHYVQYVYLRVQAATRKLNNDHTSQNNSLKTKNLRSNYWF